jgi:tRNA dimethylallyltransferase
MFSFTPLIVIVGPTSSGKSKLAIDLAKKYNGEVISADSRTVYKGMDIGTAKPSEADQKKVPHHLLDLIRPNEKFNVAQFKELAEQKIKEILARDKLPIMVGGTGLYVDSVLLDFEFSRADAEKNEVNPRHLKNSPEKTYKLARNSLIVGIDPGKDELNQKIKTRVEQMIQDGLESEVRSLAKTYGWEPEAMTGVGYREWQAYFNGEQKYDEVIELIVTHSRQYAKRQRTWFKRNPHIQWFKSPEKAREYLAKVL